MSHLKHQATTTNAREVVSCPDPEVIVKGERRQFSPAYKQRIVKEAAQCSTGEVGALLRREGLYGSHLSKWRREVAAKAAASRGTNKPLQEKAAEALATRLREVESENARLRAQLMQAEAIMAAQKKLVQSFERCLTPSKPRPSS